MRRDCYPDQLYEKLLSLSCRQARAPLLTRIAVLDSSDPHSPALTPLLLARHPAPSPQPTTPPLQPTVAPQHGRLRM